MKSPLWRSTSKHTVFNQSALNWLRSMRSFFQWNFFRMNISIKRIELSSWFIYRMTFTMNKFNGIHIMSNGKWRWMSTSKSSAPLLPAPSVSSQPQTQKKESYCSLSRINGNQMCFDRRTKTLLFQQRDPLPKFNASSTAQKRIIFF